jgi:hypothetical protein
MDMLPLAAQPRVLSPYGVDRRADVAIRKASEHLK